MTYSQIKCIDESWIDEEIVFQQKRIEEIKKSIYKDWKDKYNYEHSLELENTKAKLYILNKIKQHLTSATPILEKAFDEGIEVGVNRYDHEHKECKEQFLNTEVNI